jgi:hypothetical protein
MPTILRIGPYRFFFYSADVVEPAHIHVQRDDNVAKLWQILSSWRSLADLEVRNSERFGGMSNTISPPSSTRFMPSETKPSSWSTRAVSPAAQSVRVTDDQVIVELIDGRTISAPVEWYPRLAHGSAEERTNVELIGRGTGLHWPDLDEDLSVESMLAGRSSQEGPASLHQWLADRSGDQG